MQRSLSQRNRHPKQSPCDDEAAAAAGAAGMAAWLHAAGGGTP
jgi:hypothetical protein